MNNLLKLLDNFECNIDNVEEKANNIFNDYSYSMGCSKIVIYRKNYVVKKIFSEELIDEADFYNRIKNSEFRNLFCSTKRISNSIIIQRKVDETLREYIQKEENKIPYGCMRDFYKEKGLTDLLLRTDCVVLYYLYRQIGLEKLLKFQEFVIENNLTDLYNYNVGFIDNKIKIFDFGGSINWD